MNKRKIVGDILQGILILAGTQIPYWLSGLFVYIEDKTPFYVVQFALTCSFSFLFVLFLAKNVSDAFSGKYRDL